MSIAGYRLSLRDCFLHLNGSPKLPFFIVIVMLTYSFSEERFIGVWLFKIHPLRALPKEKKNFTRGRREEGCSSQSFTASACHVRLDYLLDRSAGEVVDTAGRFCYTLQRTNSSDAPDVKS